MVPAEVSIAFRLSDEVGQEMLDDYLNGEEDVSQLPFGFRTKWDRKDEQLVEKLVDIKLKSQLPFGFRTNWDYFTSATLAFPP